MHCRAPSLTRNGFPAHPRPTGSPHRTARRALFALVLLAALSGCAGTKVPVYATRLPEGAPVVTIHPSAARFASTRTYVSKVDGAKVKYRESFFDDGREAPVKIAAGFHEVEVTLDSGQMWQKCRFDYEFKAGHTYRVTATRSDEVLLKDLTDGTSTLVRRPTRL